jgi:hypothetical protein
MASFVEDQLTFLNDPAARVRPCVSMHARKSQSMCVQAFMAVACTCSAGDYGCAYK